MTPAEYVQFVTPVLLVGIFMWIWREHRELRSHLDSRIDKVDERIDGLQSNIDSRFDTVNKRFDTVNERIDGLQSEMRAEFLVFKKSLNELSMRVGRLEGVFMHTFRGALFGDELEDSKDSQSQLAARYEAPKKNDQVSP